MTDEVFVIGGFRLILEMGQLLCLVLEKLLLP